MSFTNSYIAITLRDEKAWKGSLGVTDEDLSWSFQCIVFIESQCITSESITVYNLMEC